MEEGITMIETEVKFLGINPRKILRKARELGAIPTREDQEGITIILSENEVVRLRKSGDETRITYKKKLPGSKYKRALEIWVRVDNFSNALKILKRAFKSKRYFKVNKRRIKFELNRTKCEIVKVKGIPTYLEIEGDPRSIERVVSLLGLDNSKRSTKTLDDLLREHGIKPKIL